MKPLQHPTSSKQAQKILVQEAVAIRRLKKRATARGKQLLGDLVEIGKRLDRAKKHVGHGNWTTWLQKNFEWSADTAANYASIYALSQTPKFRSLRNLPLEVLYSLGRRNVTDNFRAEIAERVEAGEVITAKTIVNVPVTRSVIPVTSVGYVRAPPEEEPPTLANPSGDVSTRKSKFTPKCIAQIRNLVEQGVPRQEIAAAVGVTVGALQVTCSRLGVSLRKPAPMLTSAPRRLSKPVEDIGPASSGEVERLHARIAELEDINRRLETKVIGLESEVAELRARLPKDDDIPPFLQRH